MHTLCHKKEYTLILRRHFYQLYTSCEYPQLLESIIHSNKIYILYRLSWQEMVVIVFLKVVPPGKHLVRCYLSPLLCFFWEGAHLEETKTSSLGQVLGLVPKGIHFYLIIT